MSSPIPSARRSFIDICEIAIAAERISGMTAASMTCFVVVAINSVGLAPIMQFTSSMWTSRSRNGPRRERVYSVGTIHIGLDEFSSPSVFNTRMPRTF